MATLAYICAYLRDERRAAILYDLLSFPNQLVIASAPALARFCAPGNLAAALRDGTTASHTLKVHCK
jgi:hypothetical protein